MYAIFNVIDQDFRYMKVSLEQWQTFKAVVDEGAFSKAAERLNKSQSSVSYIINRLQDQLPVPILEQKGRRAVLTEAGKVLYRQASNLLAEAEQLETTARYLASGWQAEVSIAADALTPMKQLLSALQSFSEISPGTRIRLLETVLSGTDEALLNRSADMALISQIPPGFLGTHLTNITMIPVVGKEHPLALYSQVSENDLKRFRQIVVRDSGTRRSLDSGWLGAEQRWTVSYFSTSIEALYSNLGFAFVPYHRVKQDLEEGRLVKLPLVTGADRTLPLHLILANQSNAGPAVMAVAEKIIEHIKD